MTTALSVCNLLRMYRMDLRAWWRGWERIAPRFAANGEPITRGRVYRDPASEQPPEAPKGHEAASKGEVAVDIEIRRADGRVERLTAPGTVLQPPAGGVGATG